TIQEEIRCGLPLRRRSDFCRGSSFVLVRFTGAPLAGVDLREVRSPDCYFTVEIYPDFSSLRIIVNTNIIVLTAPDGHRSSIPLPRICTELNFFGRCASAEMIHGKR